MELFEAINARRSIRKYTAEAVDDNVVQELLRAAMQAPSACNEQPWHFIVAKDAQVRALLAKTSPYTHMADNAAVVIVVAGDMKVEKAKGMWVQDCAAATQNLLLAVTAKGLGAVWCGVHPEEDREKHVREALGLPDHVIPFNLICIGHPAQTSKHEDRFKADRIHIDRW